MGNLKINILQSTNPKHRFAKFVRRKNSFNRRFVNFFSAFHFVGSKECCLHTVFSRVKEKQIGGLQCLFVVFLVALHDTFAKAFRIEAWQRSDFMNIHIYNTMRKIALISFICCLCSFNLAIGQGCAAVYAKKIKVQNGVTDTIDFSAQELNNGIQMQCGETYMLGADIFLPGGGTTQYEVEQIPYTPPVSYTIDGQGTSYASSLCNSDDAWGNLITLNYGYVSGDPDVPNFTFDFYGQTYPYAVIGANGLISFDYTNPDCVTPYGATSCKHCQYTQEGLGSIPRANRYRNCIMAPYYDINFGIGGEIYFKIIGEYPCRKMILSYYQVPMFRCTSEIATHMCVLYETSNVIEFYIQNKPICTEWENGLATLGIQNADGSDGITIPGYNSSVWSAQNEAWRIKPVGELPYTMNWYKRSATDYNQPLQEVTQDDQGRVLVDVNAESGPMRYFVKAEVWRNDGYTFEVIDSSAVYYPIDMPDIVVSHNDKVTYYDTVCRGENVNFQLSGGGENGKYYQIAPFANPEDTNTELQTTFTRVNNRNMDSVKYVFKIENYDQHGVLVCTRYDSCVVMNRSFNVELREDLTICRNDEVMLTDILNEHPGTSSWSTGATGDTLTFAPQETGNYILVKTDNLGCTASDTVHITVNDSPEVTISGTMAICAGTSTRLTATANPADCVFEWSDGSTESSIVVTPAADETYTVSVKLPPAMCETVKTATVEVKPLPTIVLSEDKLICEGETAEINVNGDATLWVWETSDPAVNGSNATNFVVSPNSSTLYRVHGYNEINCHSQDELTVTVEPKPTPIINLNPGVLDALDPTTIITDGSRGNVSRTWTLSDGFTSTDESFVHTFPLTDTTMRFDINLVAYSNAGCVDSISTFIRVKRDHFLWAPTGIYLHDNNPANREFRLWIDNIVEYELMIFNRNGELMFKTSNIEKAWNCTYKGEPVMQGVYVWKVKYRHNDAPNRLESETGTFMIYN